MSKALPLQQFVPQQTIQSYLDALLQDATESVVQDEPVSMPVESSVAKAPIREPQPEISSVEPAPPSRSVQQRMLENRTLDTQVVETTAVEAQASETPAFEVEQLVEQPSWRDQPFEALLFDVGGLTLAVPLILLGSIYPLDDEITPLFGQPDWFLGLMPTPVGNLKVLDTARWVMPERYTDALRDDLRFVISVEGYDWGLAVHGVSQSVKLTSEQIKWRSQQGKRPWLAGTVIEHMCALVDVSSLAQLIAAGEAASKAGKASGRALA
ncbi:MAG: chemotaxis protein CheW [Gammaproteobacteria bacterium HGW-Gammaproteobacteria-11]|nr:MAG: chemotaxis protein CheW [Gammaproteobacteria bacterium HGW-Gammaproteobacteria-11]